jgi:hypothetical protein
MGTQYEYSAWAEKITVKDRMATSEERIKVLRMIQEGKVTASEGLKLLEALEEGKKNPQGRSAVPEKAIVQGPGARWFRVRVTDTNTGRVRVNIRLPITVVTTGFKLGARFSPEVEGLDMTMLMDSIRSGETGQIVDVYDEQDGEHVEVFLE